MLTTNKVINIYLHITETKGKLEDLGVSGSKWADFPETSR